MSQGLVFNLDPDPASRANISQILQAGDVEVVEFASTAELLEATRQRVPQAIVIAPQVIDESGGAVSARIAAICEVPLLLRTSQDSVPDDAVNASAVVPVTAPESVTLKMLQSLLKLSGGHQRCAELQSQLEHLQQEFQICTNRTAHDVTEAIRGITTLGEMIQSNGMDRLNPAERQYLDRVLESADRARVLLRYLSAYVQASREPASSHRNVDLRGVVMAAEAQHREEIERLGATIRVEDLPVVRGNPARLQQLIGCLLSNSLKFRAPDRPLQVVIESQPEGQGRWAISFADNGTGLDSQHRESIFAPFHRLHGREIPGTGMGLALARAIVRAHGGDLTVKSAAGQGAAFHFTLPTAS